MPRKATNPLAFFTVRGPRPPDDLDEVGPAMAAGAASVIVAAELVSRPEDILPAHELEAALGLLRDLEAETESFIGIAGASATQCRSAD